TSRVKRFLKEGYLSSLFLFFGQAGPFCPNGEHQVKAAGVVLYWVKVFRDTPALAEIVTSPEWRRCEVQHLWGLPVPLTVFLHTVSQRSFNFI
ncbi:MAG: hypothetical protein ABI851_16700, partial [Saprospiraceae bacterium]